jgi:putative peptidoglycan lipid II flippase
LSPDPRSPTPTTELSAPAPLKAGANTVALTSAQPVSGVLVWVSRLGNTNGKHQAAINEIELHPPAPPA